MQLESKQASYAWVEQKTKSYYKKRFQWGFIIPRWRLWSQMIACCAFNNQKIIFIKQIETFFQLGCVLPSNNLNRNDGAPFASFKLESSEFLSKLVTKHLTF